MTYLSVCSGIELETDVTLPQKYYLTPLACKGILRRAKNRGMNELTIVADF